MARRSQKITFNSEYFKTLVDEGQTSIPSIADSIGLSKQTLYENLRDNSISKEFLVKIAKNFKLSKKEFDLLAGIKPLSVFCRREKRVEVEENKKEKIREIANLLLKITKFDSVKKHLPKFEGLNAKDLAKEIRRTLGLEERRIFIDKLIVTLEDFGIYTYFYPFDYLGLNADSNGKKIRAASIPLDNKKWVIFLDTSNEMIDGLYDLIHEVAHIFSGHDLDVDHSDKLEQYCNSVANEVLTSSDFFNEHKSDLKKYFSTPSSRIVGVAESLQQHLGCSFEGLVLALSQNGIIDEPVKRYLYAVANNKAKSAVKLSDYFTSSKDDSLASFWYKSLNDSSKQLLFKFFLLLKGAFLEGRATTRLLSQGFAIDISNADTLCKKWISENEFSDEELERFKDGPWQTF